MSEIIEIMEMMIELNLMNRLRCGQIAATKLPPDLWSKEFCTVHCNVGRCSGKTSFIKQAAKIGDLIVVQYVENKTHFINSSAKVISANEVTGETESYNFIYVDEPGEVFKIIDRDVFYKYLSDGTQTFVFIGE